MKDEGKVKCETDNEKQNKGEFLCIFKEKNNNLYSELIILKMNAILFFR